MPNIVDVWGWYNNWAMEAYISNNVDRIQILYLHEQGSEYLYKAPKTALEYYEQAIQLAQRIGEPCVELLLECGRLITYQYGLNDFPQCLQESTRIFSMVHRAPYNQCMIRGQLYSQLVNAYFYYDPVSYEKDIFKMMDDLSDKIPVDAQTYSHLNLYRALLHLELNRYDEAQTVLEALIVEIRGNPSEEANALKLMACILYARHDYSTALVYALESEKAGRTSKRDREMAVSILLVAVLYLHLNNPEKARLAHQRGVVTYLSSTENRCNAFYNANCLYFELSGNPEKAIELRNEEQLGLDKNPHPYRQALSHLAKARLLGRIGKQVQPEVELGLAQVNKMKHADHVRQKFERVRAGDYTDDYVDFD
jgi:tetratricopeptide (TPR) repeat protein